VLDECQCGGDVVRQASCKFTLVLLADDRRTDVLDQFGEQAVVSSGLPKKSDQLAEVWHHHLPDADPESLQVPPPLLSRVISKGAIRRLNRAKPLVVHGLLILPSRSTLRDSCPHVLSCSAEGQAAAAQNFGPNGVVRLVEETAGGAQNRRSRGNGNRRRHRLRSKLAGAVGRHPHRSPPPPG